LANKNKDGKQVRAHDFCTVRHRQRVDLLGLRGCFFQKLWALWIYSNIPRGETEIATFPISICAWKRFWAFDKLWVQGLNFKGFPLDSMAPWPAAVLIARIHLETG
jgi:hypothetical protein